MRDHSSDAEKPHKHVFDEKFGICECDAWVDHFNCPRCGTKTSPSYNGAEKCGTCGQAFTLDEVPRDD